MEKKLKIRDLCVCLRLQRGKLQAVRGIDLELEQGKTLALVGESGSGKSVTAKAIMGLLPANAEASGSILYGDQDILTLSERQLTYLRGDCIAMILQDPGAALDPIVPIGKQLTEVMGLKKRKTPPLSRAQAKQRALQLLEEVGIDQPEKCFHQYPFELSGGMCQRVTIAIALASDPDILICDEPTTALDVTIQAQILTLLKELQKKRGLTVLFISHDLAVVAQMADTVAVMYAGKIVEYGTAEEVFYQPAHPYTWALLSAVPDPYGDRPLRSIPGTPPDLVEPPVGDAFAARNPYAMQIDFEQEPPAFALSPTHWAATWLLHPGAPSVQMPQVLLERIAQMRERREVQPHD